MADWLSLRGRRAPRSALPPPARELGYWLLAAAAITLAPHAVLHLPAWISALGFGLLGWRGLLLWRGNAPARGWLLLLLAVAMGVAVRLHYGHFFGQEPGIALLALLLCLKLHELRSVRDVRAAVLLCFFLQIGLFFDAETLPVAALALLGMLVAVGCLHSTEDSRAPWREHLRHAGLLIAQSLPLMVVLFLLFPRIPAPLWGLPADAQRSTSGLSDTMSPGSISDLGLSAEIAFRIEFLGAIPPPQARYWRGPVLTEFDGRTWFPQRATISTQPVYSPGGPRIDYLMTLEPHNQHWLLALDFAAPDVPQARYTSDFQLLATKRVRERVQLALAAYPASRVGVAESATVTESSLRLPAAGNPRSRALAQELAQGAGSSDQIVARALAHFGSGNFVYTLEPPLLGSDTIDEFLFDTRQGFCEHYAGAFVFLMRAAGVPARVVTGYQGGEQNPFDGTLIVRQYDAHAWAEVWLPAQGWVRVDPTAQVAPQRIEDSVRAALPAAETLPLLMRPDMDWLRQIRLRWEAVSHTWDLWVLGYNTDSQRRLLERLGLGRHDWLTLAGLMSLSVAALLAILFGWAHWRQRARLDPLDRAWRRFCAKLSRSGLAREPWEGPLDYGRRIAQARPAQADTLLRIARGYADMRYGRPPTADDVRILAREIESLKIE